MNDIQSRFEVAVTELPDHIDPASYSELHLGYLESYAEAVIYSDVLNGDTCCFWYINFSMICLSTRN